VDGILDLGLHLGALLLRVHWAHAAVFVESVAWLELRCSGDQLGHEGVVYALLDVKPLRRKTLLAAVEEAAHRDGAYRPIEICVVEHDARIAAAELERDFLQLLGGLGHHALAGWGGT